MTFDKWLKQEYGQNWQGINMDLIDEGYDQIDRSNKHTELIEEFEEYCEIHEIEIIPE